MPEDGHSSAGMDQAERTHEAQALFGGLVYNEQGQRAEVVYIGRVAHYAIPDAGFLRHVEAYRVDRHIIAQLQQQISSMQDEVVRGMLSMLGKNDLMTKAAIDASLSNLEQSIRRSDSSEWVPWLKLFGFRVAVDLHGNLVEVIYPSAPEDE